MRKATARQHHATPGIKHTTAKPGVEAHSTDPAIAPDQFCRRHRGVDSHPFRECGLSQAAYQRIAIGQIHSAPVQGKIAKMPEKAASNKHRRLERAEHIEEVLQVRARLDHQPHEGHFSQWRAQPSDLRAELARIEGERVNSTTLLGKARRTRVIIRTANSMGELHLGIAFEIFEHLGAIPKEGLNNR